MYRRILVAYNGAPESRLALDEAVRIAPDASVEVHLAAVVHYPSAYLLAGEYVPEVALADEREHMEADLKTAHGLLAAKGLNVIDHLVVGEPVDVLTKLVAELGIDLLILGHPRSKSFALRWWRGSVDAILIERVRCSILVAADPEALIDARLRRRKAQVAVESLGDAAGIVGVGHQLDRSHVAGLLAEDATVSLRRDCGGSFASALRLLRRWRPRSCVCATSAR